jgi:hypothetical protein
MGKKSRERREKDEPNLPFPKPPFPKSSLPKPPSLKSPAGGEHEKEVRVGGQQEQEGGKEGSRDAPLLKNLSSLPLSSKPLPLKSSSLPLRSYKEESQWGRGGRR